MVHRHTLSVSLSLPPSSSISLPVSLFLPLSLSLSLPLFSLSVCVGGVELRVVALGSPPGSFDSGKTIRKQNRRRIRSWSGPLRRGRGGAGREGGAGVADRRGRGGAGGGGAGVPGGGRWRGRSLYKHRRPQLRPPPPRGAGYSLPRGGFISDHTRCS